MPFHADAGQCAGQIGVPHSEHRRASCRLTRPGDRARRGGPAHKRRHARPARRPRAGPPDRDDETRHRRWQPGSAGSAGRGPGTRRYNSARRPAGEAWPYGLIRWRGRANLSGTLRDGGGRGVPFSREPFRGQAAPRATVAAEADRCSAPGQVSADTRISAPNRRHMWITSEVL